MSDTYGQATAEELARIRAKIGQKVTINEPPYLTGANAEPLAVGDVFSIEPGLYVPGRYGLRYENTVALTDDGLVRLNDAPERPALTSS